MTERTALKTPDGGLEAGLSPAAARSEHGSTAATSSRSAGDGDGRQLLHQPHSGVGEICRGSPLFFFPEARLVLP